MLQPGLGIEASELVSCALDLFGREPKALAQIAPAVRDQVVKASLTSLYTSVSVRF